VTLKGEESTLSPFPSQIDAITIGLS